VFGLTANNHWCRFSDLTLMVVEQFAWARRRLNLIYGSRIFILKDTDRLDSQESQLCFRSARTRTLNVFFYRGHFSWALRGQRKHHLYLQIQLSSFFYIILLCIMEMIFPHYCTVP
jgi:hypothetical protein